MPVPSFALCLFLPVPRFPRADKVLPAQTFRFFFRSVNRVRFQRPLDVGDAVKAVPADLGELDAAAVPVALQGAGAYSEHLRRFPSEIHRSAPPEVFPLPPLRICSAISSIRPASLSKSDFSIIIMSITVAVLIVYAAKLQGRKGAGL